MPKFKPSGTNSAPESVGSGGAESFDEGSRNAGSQQHQPYPSHQPYNHNGARDSIEVHDHDVLNGRGVNMAHHPGNERFRSLIQSRSDPAYCANYSLNEKKALAEEVVRHIEALDPPGRFLKRSGKTKNRRGLQGPWEIMAREEAVKKARQALRDCNRPDRNGYAKSVAAPVDVLESAMVRKNTGLSQQQYAQQLAAATETAEAPSSSGARARRGSGSRTPNSESSKSVASNHTNIQSPVPTSPFRPQASISSNIYSASTTTLHNAWGPETGPPPSTGSGTRDVGKLRDTSQDTPTLMNSNTPTTAATSGGLFSAEEFAHSGYHHHHHSHDALDVSNAPGLDSPTHHTHFGHSLPPSPAAHGAFEEHFASIHAEDDGKVQSGFDSSVDPLQHVADEAALAGEFETDFASAFDGEGHTF